MFNKYAHVSFMPLEKTTLRKPTYPRCSEDNKYFQPATLPHVRYVRWGKHVIQRHNEFRSQAPRRYFHIIQRPYSRPRPTGLLVESQLHGHTYTW